jgi:hypothetical protein
MSPRGKSVAAAALIGAFWGVAGARFLFVGSWLSLIPWGATGIVIGALCRDKRDAVAAGATYGAALPVVFMLAGFNGVWTVPKALSFAALCAVLAAVGGGCGVLLALAGRLARRRKAEEKKKPA